MQSLEIRGLIKKYGTFCALDGLNMTVRRGDIYGFLGRNGSGKTTTLNIISGVISKDSGDVRFTDDNGATLDTTPKIGYLIETPSLYKFMSAREYMEYIASCANIPHTDARIEELIDLVGLNNVGTRRIGGFSRGMLQRLGAAAAMLPSPELLLLDEPTSALDPEGRNDVMHLIRRLNESGVTILLCTHILNDAQSVCNRIGIVRQGQIVAEGTVAELIAGNADGGGIEINLCLNDRTEAVVYALRALPCVTGSNFDLRTGNLTLGGNSAELRAAATRYLADTNAEYNGITVTSAKLENIYLDNA